MALTRRDLIAAGGLVGAASAIDGAVATTIRNGKSATFWVDSWGTAQQVVPDPPIRLPPPPPSDMAKPSPPPAAPPSPIVPVPDTVQGTVRMIARTTLGGDRLRLSFSNPIGADIVSFGAVRVGLARPDGSVVPGSDRQVRFGGKAGVTLFNGALVTSDPVDFVVPALTKLVISIHVAQPTATKSVHLLGLNQTRIVAGDDATAATDLAGGTTVRSYLWLTGIAVERRGHAAAVVALGDSITDGFSTTPGANLSWPEVLASRLQQEAGAKPMSVLNMGISGGRVVRNGAGASALARFDRDVLARCGVRWVILLEGINDINFGQIPGVPASEHATADQIIEGYRQIIDRCHAHSIRVMGGTLLPVGGLTMFTAEAEAMRQAVNWWIRTSGMFDAVVDFDVATRDPSSPSRLLPKYDSGDHVHPSDAGNIAMANAIDVGILAHAIDA